MVEFYFARLVEEVRNAAAGRSQLETRDEDDVQAEGDQDMRDRRVARADGELVFCLEGCYWPCEHR